MTEEKVGTEDARRMGKKLWELIPNPREPLHIRRLWSGLTWCCGATGPYQQ